MMDFMKRMLGRVKGAAKDEEGASGLEYAVLAAMVVVVLTGFVPGISDAISSIFNTVQTALTTATGTGGGG
jgi:pilus assembly protein Flp/PilA